MANLMLTNYCNLNCAYCFGVEQMAPKVSAQLMPKELYIDILAWLARSETKHLHLMGGEPTLHPDFIWMLKYARQAGFSPDVFSNGITEFDPVEMMEVAEHVNGFIININDPRAYPGTKREKLERFLAALGPKAALTFNVTGPEFDAAHVIDYINRFGLERYVKLGIALPTMNRDNEFAGAESFSDLSETVITLAKALHKEGIDGGFECGVPRCFFTPEQQAVVEATGFAKYSPCASILDVTPDGDVIYCLPLANGFRARYSDYTDYEACRKAYSDFYAERRIKGFKEECHDCEYLNRCKGSCISRTLSTAELQP